VSFANFFYFFIFFVQQHKDLAALLERAGNERKAAPDSAPESDVVTPIADGHSPRLVETA
jgi:hypothetical protein